MPTGSNPIPRPCSCEADQRWLSHRTKDSASFGASAIYYAGVKQAGIVAGSQAGGVKADLVLFEDLNSQSA